MFAAFDPLAQYQRCFADVFERAGTAPLHVAHDGVQIGGCNRVAQIGRLHRLGALECICGNFKQRMGETKRLRPLLVAAFLIRGGQVFGALFGE